MNGDPDQGLASCGRRCNCWECTESHCEFTTTNYRRYEPIKILTKKKSILERILDFIKQIINKL